MRRLCLLFCLLIACLTPAAAQQESPSIVTIAANVQGNYALDEVLDELHLIRFDTISREVIDQQIIAESQFLRNLVWRDDGRMLAYVSYFSPGDFSPDMPLPIARDQLWLLPVDPPGEPFRVAERVDTALPPAFTEDGEGLLTMHFTENVIQTSEGAWVEYALHQVPLEPAPDDLTLDDLPYGDRVGSVLYGPGCGSWATLGTQQRLDGETGYNLSQTILNITPQGLLFTSECSRSEFGLVSIGDAEHDLIREPRMSRAKLSPDKTQLAGRISGLTGFGVRDLATGEVTTYETAEAVYQLAFGTDGTMIYSTRTEIDRFTLTPEEQEAFQEAYFGGTMGSAGEYALSIRRYDIASGDDTLLYESVGSGIGRLSASPDGSGLFFSEVGLIDDWYTAIIERRYDLNTVEGQRALYREVDLTLYFLPFDDSDPVVVGQNLAQHVVSPGLLLES